MSGFSDDELLVLGSIGNVGLTDPDAVPELPVEAVPIPGDLWLLGQPQLLCGDSTVAADVGKVLGRVRQDLMVTDPCPYRKLNPVGVT